MNHPQLLVWREKTAIWWQARAPRERLALLILAGTLLLALGLQLLWSLEQARRTQLRRLPALQAEASQMRALREEWLALRESAAGKPAPRGDTARQVVDSQLGELGKDVRARWNAQGELQIDGQASHARWLAWVARMQQDNRLRLLRGKFRPNGELLQIEAVLGFPGDA